MSDPEIAESTDVLKHFEGKTSDDMVVDETRDDTGKSTPWILTPRILMAIALGQVCNQGAII